jgi:hypothetical protein
MATFKFLEDIDTSPLSDFWRLHQHDIPASPGVYFLIARPGVRFLYPTSMSSIFYIGQASSLRRRLSDHLKYSTHVRENRRVTHSLYWPRYEYAGAHGGRYCFIRTWQGCTPKALEDIVLARFAKRYRAFPVGNGAGAWNRIV